MSAKAHSLMTKLGKGPKFTTRAILLAGVASVCLPGNLVAQENENKDGTTQNTIVLEAISVEAKADVIKGGIQLDEDELDRIAPKDIKDVFR
ncbi:MAG: hypothetical protein MI743_09155, partial [Sneathiellales bacterium]|nr:hypothetical protein [Sneathiellales bacterium]